MMDEPKLPDTHQISMLTFAMDLPNICSLVGLLCAGLSMYFSIMGNFPAAIIGMLWAVFFDWGDGIIARQMKNRTPLESTTFLNSVHQYLHQQLS